MEAQLLNRKQVADRFSVKPDTVTKWKNKGIITPSCWVNGRPRYKTDDLSNILKTNPEKEVPNE